MAQLTDGAVNGALMAGIGLGVIALDRELIVEQWNEWLVLQTQIESGEAVGRPLLDLFPCLLERGMESKMRQVMETGMAQLLSPLFHRYFIPIRTSEGIGKGQMAQQAKLLPLKDGQNTIGLLVLIEDYSERMEFEQRLAKRNAELKKEHQHLQAALDELHVAHRELTETQEKLIEAERLKTLMETAGAAAHEINQPLQAISLCAEIMLYDNRVDEQGKKGVESIREQVERISGILRQMKEIQHYSTMPYPGGGAIVNFEAAGGS